MKASWEGKKFSELLNSFAHKEAKPVRVKRINRIKSLIKQYEEKIRASSALQKMAPQKVRQRALLYWLTAKILGAPGKKKDEMQAWIIQPALGQKGKEACMIGCLVATR